MTAFIVQHRWWIALLVLICAAVVGAVASRLGYRPKGL